MPKYLIVKVDSTVQYGFIKMRRAIHRASKEQNIPIEEMAIDFRYGPKHNQEFLMSEEDQDLIQDIFNQAMIKAKEHNANLKR